MEEGELKEFVVPKIAKARKEKTGAAIEDDGNDFTDGLDWEDILKGSKWPLLTFFNLLKDHPTLGMSSTQETVSSSEDSEHSDQDAGLDNTNVNPELRRRGRGEGGRQ